MAMAMRVVVEVVVVVVPRDAGRLGESNLHLAAFSPRFSGPC